jgi:thiamine-phosphate pyrophosphorylase
VTLRERLAVYVITDRALARGRDEVAIARAALRGGATALQLRGKQQDARPLCELGRALLRATREAGALLIVNDRLDVALAIGADGVHLGQDDLPCAEARRIAGPGLLIGVSAESPRLAAAAERDGADYLGTGSVYATSSKADAGEPIGLAGLAEVVAATRLPVVAIGGIGPANAAACVAAGACGVAVISAVVAAEDPEAAARELARVVRGR